MSFFFFLSPQCAVSACFVFSAVRACSFPPLLLSLCLLACCMPTKMTSTDQYSVYHNVYYTKMLSTITKLVSTILVVVSTTPTWCLPYQSWGLPYQPHLGPCRQATGGFKGANRDSLVFSLQETKVILAQVVRALQGVHCKQTLHGDVKTDNFLVSKNKEHF